jgi:DNA primase
MKNSIKELQDIIHGHGKAITPGAKVVSATKGESQPKQQEEEEPTIPSLTVVHEQKLWYNGRICNYYVLGNLPQDFSSMLVTLSVTEDTSERRCRCRLNLYEREECRQCATEIANRFYADHEVILSEMVQLTNLLEQHRDSQLEAQQAQYKVNKPQSHMLPLSEKAAIEFLSEPKIAERIDKLLAQAGIQDKQRLLLYMVGASYKNHTPLHVGITGNNSSIKNLVNLIGQCLPAEDTLLLNNISAKSLYHATQGELMHKVILLPYGLDKKVIQALNLLQQGETLTTATSTRDKLGNIVSAFKQVHSHFSTIMYMQSVEADGDHLIITNTELQADMAMQYYNKKVAGLIDEKEESNARQMLQNLVRCIKPMEVVNPKAGGIIIPVHEDSRAYVNRVYQEVVMQVCLMHQYRRRKDVQGRLVAEAEDMRMATEILFGALILNACELDVLTRKFYEQLKKYVKEKAVDKKEEYWFTMQELRRELGFSGSGSFRHITKLFKLDYLEREGHANRGYRFRIVYWEDMDKLRKQVQDNLISQLELSGIPNDKYTVGKPRTKPAKRFTAGTPELENFMLNAPTPAYGKKPKNKKRKTKAGTKK